MHIPKEGGGWESETIFKWDKNQLAPVEDVPLYGMSCHCRGQRLSRITPLKIYFRLHALFLLLTTSFSKCSKVCHKRLGGKSSHHVKCTAMNSYFKASVPDVCFSSSFDHSLCCKLSDLWDSGRLLLLLLASYACNLYAGGKILKVLVLLTVQDFMLLIKRLGLSSLTKY